MTLLWEVTIQFYSNKFLFFRVYWNLQEILCWQIFVVSKNILENAKMFKLHNFCPFLGAWKQSGEILKLSNFTQMFYFMHNFYRKTFEMAIFHLQSKKCTWKMSKSENFPSFLSIFWGLDTILENLSKHDFSQTFKVCCTGFSYLIWLWKWNLAYMS